MEPMGQPQADDVLAAWAPAGMGHIVVVLGRGVVIHKAIVSGKAGAASSRGWRPASAAGLRG
ncbi:hypothetical protein AMK09_08935 [Streptomyces sp. CB02488]|nr:hypothetical protein AMK09_08935 [Streptomyces sp. CB02488]